MSPISFPSAVVKAILTPRERLEDRLRLALGADNLGLRSALSGRASLLHIFKLHLTQGGSGTALIPEYVCDVVHKAAMTAGLDVVTYATGDDFEPARNDLMALVHRHPEAVLIFAPLYGSTGGIQLLDDDAFADAITQTRTRVCLDLCQDIQLVETYADLARTLDASMIISFNDKSIPGMMGGALLAPVGSRWLSGWLPPPTLAEKLRLSYLSVRKFLLKPVAARVFGITRPSPAANRFEYSECRIFPYAIEETGASKLQLALASIAISSLSTFNRERQKIHKQFNDKLLLLPHSATATFKVLRTPTDRLKAKKPYATWNDHTMSYRPALMICHTKGFDDWL